MRRWLFIAGTCALIAIVLAAYWIIAREIVNTVAAPSGAEEHRQLPPEPLNAAIDAGVAYLVRNCMHDGRFVYRVNMDRSIHLERKYNMLRHCGVMYALAMYNDRYASPEVVEVLRRCGLFLRSQIGAVEELKDTLAVWSAPVITHSHSPLSAKLGGTGLGLAALCSLEKHLPHSTDISVLRSMGNFIIWMQKPDGSFHSKYVPSQAGKNGHWVSLYYPGEAALGLLLLYELDPDSKWLNASAKAIGYLAKLRRGFSNVEADHWALIATGKLLPRLEKSNAGISKKLLLGHSSQIVDRILKDRVRDTDNSVLDGGFSEDGRVCPTATKLEGLIAASKYLQLDRGRKDKLLNAIKGGIKFLLAAQVKEGKFKGGFPRAVARLKGCDKNMEKFNRRATEIRIDYVQHAICAMLAFLDAGMNLR